jgi:uncharacterized membrane protein YciS (DUF1049 family)
MASHVAHETSEKEIPAPQTAAIWKTFWILLVLTAIEFVIAFTLPASTLRVAIFSGMGEFMHLKHEVKTLIWMVLIPTLFVVWLLTALMYEGGHLY